MKRRHRPLEGQSALVTGGARNIGRAIAEALAFRGAAVAIADMGHDLETIPYSLAATEELAHTVEGISDRGTRAIGIPCDIRVESQVRDSVRRVLEEFGRLDILVNNAGVSSLYPVQELSEQAWSEVVDVCLKGTFLCCKHAVPAMIRQHYGRIVNIASVAGLRGLGYSAHYCAAKHGVIGLTRALALELADHGILVQAVCPGTVESPILQGLASQAGLTADPYDHFSQSHLLKDRPITARDIAEAVCWLTSGESRCLTGNILTVDAGWTAR
jgi:NAD(P)-dependent dehydrogenase (short-subunit alcohol dehydrogenase family)